jgi:putative component of toxin-antitoxin plasmid stabilization module
MLAETLNQPWARTPERLIGGNPGGVRPVGAGVSELRSNFGPGF